MIVKERCVVSFKYTISKESGEVIDTTSDNEAISYIHGVGAMLPGIEKALDSQKVGFTYDGVIEPKDAYGEYIPENVMPVPKSHFAHMLDQMEEGKLYRFDTGGGNTQLMKVVKIDENIITMDANHPLAGESIKLNCSIVDIREATEDEINSLTKKSCGCGGRGKSEGGCCKTKAGSEKEKSSCGSGCGCSH